MLPTDNAESRKPGIFSFLARGIAQILVMALVLGVSFAATLQLVRTKPVVPKRPVFPTVYTVETVIVRPADYQPIITLYGEVLASRTVDLRSLVSGEIISTSPKLKSGGIVEKGETLLEIDPFDYAGALREAKANADETAARMDEADARVKLEQSRLQSARDQLVLAKNDLSRIEQLRKRGTATEKQVEERKLILSQREQLVEQSEINLLGEKAKIAQLKANIDRLDWKVEQSERNLKNTRLVAPFSGTIKSSSAEIGKLVNANDIAVSMYQADSLEARFILTDERFGRLQSDQDGIVGRKLEITWNVGGIDYNFPGVIDRVGAEISSASGGVEIFATIGEGDHGISMRPGAFVEITMPDSTFKNHVRLPDSAVYNATAAYVVKDGVLVERQVEIAAFDGDYVLVSSGLQENDEVLVTRISEISAGLKVRKEGDPEEIPGSRTDKPAQGDWNSAKPDSGNEG
jgi:RND family efflux transporter MFP subunit